MSREVPPLERRAAKGDSALTELAPPPPRQQDVSFTSCRLRLRERHGDSLLG